MREITITANDAGRRLDRFLRKFLKNAALGEIYKFIRKDVKVDGKRRSESYILSEGEVLSLYLSDDELRKLSRGRFTEDSDVSLSEHEPLTGPCGSYKAGPSSKAADTGRNFELIFEDDNLLVAGKPFGLLTHGDSYEKKKHLTNQVRDYLIASGSYNPRTEKVFAPAPANRLDRNTSGIVLFGKTSESLRELTRMIREDEIRKFYLTIACGEIRDEMHLSADLTKDEQANKVRVGSHDDSHSGFGEDSGKAKEIKTSVRPLEILEFGKNYKATLCEVELITGRSHQIRAHLSAEGHPLIGDSKYSLQRYRDVNAYIRNATGLSTQFLHACRVEFSDDVRASDCLGYLAGRSFESRLPKRLASIYQDLGGTNSNI